MAHKQPPSPLPPALSHHEVFSSSAAPSRHISQPAGLAAAVPASLPESFRRAPKRAQSASDSLLCIPSLVAPASQAVAAQFGLEEGVEPDEGDEEDEKQSGSVFSGGGGAHEFGVSDASVFQAQSISSLPGRADTDGAPLAPLFALFNCYLSYMNERPEKSLPFAKLPTCFSDLKEPIAELRDMFRVSENDVELEELELANCRLTLDLVFIVTDTDKPSDAEHSGGDQHQSLRSPGRSGPSNALYADSSPSLSYANAYAAHAMRTSSSSSDSSLRLNSMSSGDAQNYPHLPQHVLTALDNGELRAHAVAATQLDAIKEFCNNLYYQMNQQVLLALVDCFRCHSSCATAGAQQSSSPFAAPTPSELPSEPLVHYAMEHARNAHLSILSHVGCLYDDSFVFECHPSARTRRERLQLQFADVSPLTLIENTIRDAHLSLSSTASQEPCEFRFEPIGTKYPYFFLVCSSTSSSASLTEPTPSDTTTTTTTTNSAPQQPAAAQMCPEFWCIVRLRTSRGPSSQFAGEPPSTTCSLCLAAIFQAPTSASLSPQQPDTDCSTMPNDKQQSFSLSEVSDTSRLSTFAYNGTPAKCLLDQLKTLVMNRLEAARESVPSTAADATAHTEGTSNQSTSLSRRQSIQSPGAPADTSRRGSVQTTRLVRLICLLESTLLLLILVQYVRSTVSFCSTVHVCTVHVYSCMFTPACLQLTIRNVGFRIG